MIVSAALEVVMNSIGSETVERMVLIVVLLIVALTVYSWLIPKLQGSLEKTVNGKVNVTLAMRRER